MSTRPPRSIRARLARSLVLWLAAVLLLVGVAQHLFMRLALTAQFDGALVSKAAVLAAAAKLEPTAEGGHVEFDMAPESMPEFQGGREPEYFELWSLGPDDASTTATVVERSGTLAGADLPRRDDPGTLGIANIKLPDGRDGRIAWLRFIAHPDRENATDAPRPAGSSPVAVAAPAPRMLIAVARSRRDIDGPLGVMLAGLFGAGLLFLGGAVVAVLLAVRSGLAPMEDLGAAVASLEPADLPARLNLPESPREIRPVRARLDELLTRLRDAIERERRFAGAAAHELRTPLAELGSLLDVRLKWPESQEACTATLREARAVSASMERLVEMLLSLARAQGVQPEHAEPIDPAPILRAALSRHAGAAAGQRPAVETAIADGLRCRADPAAFASIIDNLLGNAVQYTAPGGRVQIALTGAGTTGGAILTITNGPTDLTAADFARLGEPFWRKDAARSSSEPDDRHHLGLGLALVNALAKRANVRFETFLEDQGTLVVRLSFPA